MLERNQSLTDEVLAEIDALTSGDTSGFWRTLGRKHRDLIARYGFENFKRTINFEYGQWGVSTLHHRFIRRLLWSSLRSGNLLTGILARPNLNDAENIRWPDVLDGDSGETLPIETHADRRKLAAYARYCGLLWQFAAKRDTLGCLDIPEPSLGHPMPVFWRGRLISQDLAMATLDLNAIADVVDLGSVSHVLEIGAGYGRMAYLFNTLFPKAEYTIFDIPPAVVVSKHYLAATRGHDVVKTWLPAKLDTVPDGYFDLAINVSSFDEMPPDVSSHYISTIDRICRGHFYLNGFARTSHWGNRRGLDEITFPARWQALMDRPHPICSGFVEKMFAIQ